MADKTISRRDFLKTGALSSLGLSLGLTSTASANGSSPAAGTAKNIIFMVSDGMSSGTLTLANLVKQRQFGKTTNWISLYESDRSYHRGLMDMASLNSPVTGSAAAASSWGCGHRINNTAINWGPNDEEYKPICQIFKDAGRSAGLVTTTRITHATPSGFSINMPKRGMEDEIAAQHLERDIDVLMGGGRRHFTSDSRDDGRNLISEFEQKGYSVASKRSELEQASTSDKLLALFSDDHIPYTLDRNSDSELQRDVPTLQEMTETALNRLSANTNGFILQVEGGRVDHAAHDNDAGGLIYDQIAFDDAIETVMKFTEGRDDTLVILCTDHGNANPGLNGLGSKYSDSPKMLDTVFDYNHSFEWILNELDFSWRDRASSNQHITQAKIKDVLEAATSTQITNNEARLIKASMLDQFDAPFDDRESPYAVMGGVLANHNGIYFTGTNHTSDYVEIAAWGPGHEQIPTFVRNTDIFDLMVETAGVGK